MAVFPTVTDDDGTGTTGTILDQALFHSVRDYAGVAWTDVAFSAGNFTANNSMTWTLASGDQTTFTYVEHGKTMIISVLLVTTTVGGTPSTQLRIAVPNGRTIQTTCRGVFNGTDNGTDITGMWEASAGNTYIALYKNPSAGTWTASTNNTAIFGQFTIEID